MKKTLVATLATTFVLSAVSTTFAAPTDEEVAELRARIAELERIVQQQNNNSARKSDINKLDSRVGELEEKSSKPTLLDKFNITGEMRYRYWNLYKSPDVSQLQLRLFPTFKIDEHFTVKSRITGSYDIKGDGASNAALTYAYLESKFGTSQINVGKVPFVSQADSNPNSGSMVADDFFSGIQFVTGEDVKLYINGGHWSKGVNGDYIGAEVTGKFGDSFNGGIGYHYFKRGSTDSKNSIITGGLGYKLNEDIGLYGAVAHNTEADSDKTGYNIEVAYKGAKRAEKATWGAYAAYRYVPSRVGIASTYDTFSAKDKKGFEFGATWTPYKNTLTKLAYFHGKKFKNAGDDRTFFARASIFF